MMNPSPSLPSREQVDALGPWLQRIPLSESLVTPGSATPDPAMMRLPDSLEGKRVLDARTKDGFWAFEAIRRGASEVVALEDVSGFLGSPNPEELKHAAERFALARSALGIPEEKCRFLDRSVLQVSRDELGTFDLVLFLDGFQRQKYPMLALDKLSLVGSDTLLVEAPLCDDFSPHRGGLGNGHAGSMVLEFYPRNELQGHFGNWWTPTLQTLGHMVMSAGFNHVDGWKSSDTPATESDCRGVILGRKVKA